MSKMIAFRVDDELGQKIRQRAQASDLPVSEYVRRAVERVIDVEPEPSLYDATKALIGKYDSGRDDLSTNRKRILSEKLRAKHNR